MGEAPNFDLPMGIASKMPTGGMLPEGANAVVMLEHVQQGSGGILEILRPVAPGDNVIRRGEDIGKGAEVLHKGRMLRAQDIGALAGIGITFIEVFKKPVLSLISTGDEIVSAGSHVLMGQVRDINSFTLAGLVKSHGGILLKKGIFRDDYGIIKEATEESLENSDMVLISGGTSAGEKDMTAAIIDDIGTPGVLFHGVALKPGKPMIGRVEKTGLMGTVKAIMAKNIASAAGREDHIRVYLEDNQGTISVFPVLGKSGLINTMVKAHGIVVVTREKLGLDAGEEVDVRL